MENKDEKKSQVMIREKHGGDDNKEIRETDENIVQRYKKPLIYVLMAIVFIGCLFLIFAPKKNDKIADLGMDGLVPQATDTTMQGDKEKAYEAELLEEKQKQKRNAISAMSEYFNEDSLSQTKTLNPLNNGQQSYQDIKHTLGNFYEDDSEKETLKRELQELKQKLYSSNEAQRDPLQDQMALMEKSYQMAAKYMPSTVKSNEDSNTVPKQSSNQKDNIQPVYTAEKQVVSALYREKSDSAFLADVQKNRGSRLYSIDDKPKSTALKNSIAATIQETKTITVGGSVQIRLLESAKTAKFLIPAGTILTAFAKIGDGRLQLHIGSLEYHGNIIPVDINIYDLDGQIGLNLPYSAEANAFKEIASSMNSSSGTNITLSSSTGQQLISDMTKGVVQGASGYLAKKINAPKITLKAGHRVFLLPKK